MEQIILSPKEELLKRFKTVSASPIERAKFFLTLKSEEKTLFASFSSSEQIIALNVPNKQKNKFIKPHTIDVICEYASFKVTQKQAVIDAKRKEAEKNSAKFLKSLKMQAAEKMFL